MVGVTSGWRSPPVYRGRGPRSGEGVQNTQLPMNYFGATLTPFKHPLTAKAVPSPYKQGESAIRVKSSPYGMSKELSP